MQRKNLLALPLTNFFKYVADRVAQAEMAQPGKARAWKVRGGSPREFKSPSRRHPILIHSYYGGHSRILWNFVYAHLDDNMIIFLSYISI